MQRQLMPGEAFVCLIALVCAIAALASAFLLWFDDLEWQASAFTLGGSCLLFWGALRLSLTASP